jgi:hypothetical protein
MIRIMNSRRPGRRRTLVVAVVLVALISIGAGVVLLRGGSTGEARAEDSRAAVTAAVALGRARGTATGPLTWVRTTMGRAMPVTALSADDPAQAVVVVQIPGRFAGAQRVSYLVTYWVVGPSGGLGDHGELMNPTATDLSGLGDVHSEAVPTA